MGSNPTASAISVLVCGGRNYEDRAKVWWTLGHQGNIGLIIHGGAKGADSFAAEWAQAEHIPTLEFLPQWNKYGKAAGPIRNQLMLDEGKPDLVIAFPGKRGTADMISRAKKAGIEVIEIGKTTQ